MTNFTNNVFYTGVTSNLAVRVYQHKNKLIKGFTSKYHLTKLVYYEICEEAISAIKREKQIKGGSRQKKISLIVSTNPQFHDLYESILR